MDIIKISVILALVAMSIIYYIVAYKSMHLIKDLNDFFLSSRTLNKRSIFHSTFAQGMSLATVFIAFLQLAGILKGVLIWASLTYAAGWFAFAFLSKKINNLSDIGTLHGFIGQKYKSKTILFISSIATSIGFIGILSTELIVGSNIFSKLNTVNINFYYYGLSFIAICLIIYTTLGGFRAVIMTDIIQSFLILSVTVIFIIVGIIIINNEPTITLRATMSDFFNFEGSSFTLLLNLFLINTLFPFVDMSAWQRLIASKNATESKKGTILASVVFLLTWLILIVVSIIISNKIDTSANDGGLSNIFYLISSYGINKVLIFVLCFVAFSGFISAMLSTADSFLISASQTVSTDILYRDKKLSDSQIISKSRIQLSLIVIIGTVISLILYNAGFKIVDLIFSIYGATLSLFPLVLVAFFHPNPSKLKVWGLISVIFGIVLAWLNGFYTIFSQQNNGLMFNLKNGILNWYNQPSTYNSPTIAVISSGIILLIGILINFKSSK